MYLQQQRLNYSMIYWFFQIHCRSEAHFHLFWGYWRVPVHCSSFLWEGFLVYDNKLNLFTNTQITQLWSWVLVIILGIIGTTNRCWMGRIICGIVLIRGRLCRSGCGGCRFRSGLWGVYPWILYLFDPGVIGYWVEGAEYDQC